MHGASCPYSVRCDQGSHQRTPWHLPAASPTGPSPVIVARLTGEKWDLGVIVGCTAPTVSEFSVFSYGGGLFLLLTSAVCS